MAYHPLETGSSDDRQRTSNSGSSSGLWAAATAPCSANVRRPRDLGLIVRKTQGNQVLYQANRKSPLFPEMRGLVAKTAGVRDPLRSALSVLGEEIKLAFVYRSVARLRERADSDLDLMVLGSAPFAEVVAALARAQQVLAREINPTVFPVSQFRGKLAAGNHFLRSVMKEKKLFAVGTEHELAKLAAK